MKEISFKMGKNYEQNRKFCVVKVETLTPGPVFFAGVRVNFLLEMLNARHLSTPDSPFLVTSVYLTRCVVQYYTDQWLALCQPPSLAYTRKKVQLVQG